MDLHHLGVHTSLNSATIARLCPPPFKLSWHLCNTGLLPASSAPPPASFSFGIAPSSSPLNSGAPAVPPSSALNGSTFGLVALSNGTFGGPPSSAPSGPNAGVAVSRPSALMGTGPPSALAASSPTPTLLGAATAEALPLPSAATADDTRAFTFGGTRESDPVCRAVAAVTQSVAAAGAAAAPVSPAKFVFRAPRSAFGPAPNGQGSEAELGFGVKDAKSPAGAKPSALEAANAIAAAAAALPLPALSDDEGEPETVICKPNPNSAACLDAQPTGGAPAAAGGSAAGGWGATFLQQNQAAGAAATLAAQQEAEKEKNASAAPGAPSGAFVMAVATSHVEPVAESPRNLVLRAICSSSWR